MNTVFHVICMFQIADGLRSSNKTFCQFTKKKGDLYFLRKVVGTGVTSQQSAAMRNNNYL